MEVRILLPVTCDVKRSLRPQSDPNGRGTSGVLLLARLSLTEGVGTRSTPKSKGAQDRRGAKLGRGVPM